MPDTSSGGTLLHSFTIFDLACKARDRAKELANSNPPKPLGEAITALLLSAATIEGFINEIVDLPNFRTTPMDLATKAGYDRYVKASHVFHIIEKARGQTDLKYMMVSQVLSDQMFETGSAPLQDVILLFDLRHMIMHLKRTTQTMSIVDGVAMAGELPPKIKTLQTRGLARGPGFDWFSAIQTYEMADWACQTALTIMRATIAILPPGFHQNVFTHILDKRDSPTV